MDNPKKLTTQGTQYEEKHSIICVEQHRVHNTKKNTAQYVLNNTVFFLKNTAQYMLNTTLRKQTQAT
jgi:hypothetical protein